MRTFVIFAVFAGLNVAAVAQPVTKPAAHGAGLGKTDAISNEELNIRAYIELLRTNVKKAKAQVMSEVMDLDAEQAAMFWPIYKDFETELAALGDQVLSVVRKYVDTYERMTDGTADEIAIQVLNIEQQRIELKKKYYSKIRTGISAVVGARFLHVENQLERLIDLQIAAQLPVAAPR